MYNALSHKTEAVHLWMVEDNY